jgi:hypothetical protein
MRSVLLISPLRLAALAQARLCRFKTGRDKCGALCFSVGRMSQPQLLHKRLEPLAGRCNLDRRVHLREENQVSSRIS